MIRLVIDASVAIKWVIEEVGTAEALELRQHHLLAPDLLVVECANVLWKKVRRKELTNEQAQLAARLLERADIELLPMRRLLEDALTLSLTLGHPAYDCAYLALAAAQRCDFVTADERLVSKAGKALKPNRAFGLREAARALAE